MPRQIDKDSLKDVILSCYRTDGWKEGSRLEFKACRNGLPPDMWETYSSFCNTNGGIILLGVDDNGDVLGVKNAASRHKEIINSLNNRNKCSMNLCSAEGDIAEIQLEGKIILAMRVPPASPACKPVYLNGNPKNCYLREHDADRKCTDAEIARMLRDQGVMSGVESSPDMTILPNTSLTDLDSDTIRRYRQRVQNASPDSPWLEESDEDFLKKLLCCRTDRQTGKSGITLAALLMFGKAESIYELLPHYQLDYFEYDDSSNRDARSRWSDRISSENPGCCNLFQFFFKVLPRLKENIKKPFQLNDDLTRTGDSPAQIAVREALANALVHADYQCNKHIRISQFPEKLVLTNPGTLLMSKERLFEPHESICRNRVLQRLFDMMGVVDKAGSGVDKIVRGLMEQCLSFPSIHEDRVENLVTWELPYLGLVPKEKMEAVMQKIGRDAFSGLNWMEKLILMAVPDDNYVSNKDIRSFIPIHPADMSRHLSHLVAIGCLLSRGRSNATKYCLAFRVGGVDSSAHKKETTPHIMAPNSAHKEEGTPHITLPDSAHSDDFILAASNLPAAELERFAEVVKQLGLSVGEQDAVMAYRMTRRATPQKTDCVIIQLCTGRWVTLAQMGVLMSRNLNSLRQHALKTLIRHKYIKCRFNDINHPQQAYSADENHPYP